MARLLQILLLFTLALQCLCGRDFYKILGIRRNADDKEIKKAYRKLALKYHPDRVDESERETASSKFAEVANAYETLSDPEKRRMYDQVGEETGRPPPPQGPQGGGGFGGPHFSSSSTFSSHSSGGGGFSDPQSIFNMFFGGGSGGDGSPFGGGMNGMPGGQQQAPPQDLYEDEASKLVVKLNRLNFKTIAGKEQRGHKVIVLHFYTPADGSCRKLAPELKKIASSLQGAVTVAVVNCLTSKAICDAYHVKSFPTLKVLFPGGSAEDYSGALTFKAIRDAAVAKIPARVSSLPGSGPSSRLALEKLSRRCKAQLRPGMRSVGGCIVLFLQSDRDEVPPTFAALASNPAFDAGAPADMTGRPGFLFTMVRSPKSGKAAELEKDAKSVASELGITSLPAVALLIGESVEDFKFGLLTPSSLASPALHAPPNYVRGRILHQGEKSVASLQKWLAGLQSDLKKGLSANRSGSTQQARTDKSEQGEKRSAVGRAVRGNARAPTLAEVAACLGVNGSTVLESHPELVEAVAQLVGLPHSAVSFALKRFIARFGVGNGLEGSASTSLCAFVLPQSVPLLGQREILRKAANIVASHFADSGKEAVHVFLVPEGLRSKVSVDQHSDSAEFSAGIVASMASRVSKAASWMAGNEFGRDSDSSEGISSGKSSDIGNSLLGLVIDRLAGRNEDGTTRGLETMPEIVIVRQRKGQTRAALAFLPRNIRSSVLASGISDQDEDDEDSGVRIEEARKRAVSAVAKSSIDSIEGALQGDLPMHTIADLGLQAVKMLFDNSAPEQTENGSGDVESNKDSHEEL